MSKHYKSFIRVISLSCLLLLVSHTVNARIICWTNNEGVRECGDRIPPEYSQKGHEELSEGGLVIEEQERAKTEEEIEEEKRLAAIEEEEMKLEEEQGKKDLILTQTYSSVNDIENARDEKLKLIDVTIGLTNKRNEKIQQQLDQRIQQAADIERSGKAPSEGLLNDIESLKKQLQDNKDFINQKIVEQNEVRENYAKDIERYKELQEESL